MSNDIKEAKLSTIAGHIKTLKADRYSAEMSLILEKSLSTRYPEVMASLENQIVSYSEQIASLEKQYASIEAE